MRKLRHKGIYNRQNLAIDLGPAMRPLTNQQVADALTTVGAHLRTALWQYERVEVPGLGIVEIVFPDDNRFKIRFVPDPLLVKELGVIFKTLEK